jgi:hypothetical protein
MYPVAGGLTEVERIVPHGVVIVEPCKEFSGGELDVLAAYVEGGGRVLVLDSVLNERSTASQVLGRFGMATYVYADPGDSSSHGVTARLGIRGGEVLEGGGSGHIVVATASLGAGIVVVAVDSFRYSGHVLGGVLQKGTPSAATREHYSAACNLLKDVFMAEPVP